MEHGRFLAMRQALTLDPGSIARLLDAFLDRRFDLATAEQLFGKVVGARGSDDLVLEGIAPPGVERVGIMLMDLPEGRAVMQLHIELKEPRAVDLDAFEQLLGPPTLAPRLHPAEPEPYVYDRTGRDFEGNLELEILVDPSGRPQLKALNLVRLLRP
jgi:hypothetical protein